MPRRTDRDERTPEGIPDTLEQPTVPVDDKVALPQRFGKGGEMSFTEPAFGHDTHRSEWDSTYQED